MFFSSSWIKKMQIKYKKMDKNNKSQFTWMLFILNQDKIDKRMWHQDMKLPHIRKTHPYINAWSFKTGGDTAISPIRDHRPDHMTWVEAVISGLCIFVVEKNTHRPQIVCFLSTTNKDDPCLLPIYTDFLFFCFYWVLLFTLAFFFFN